MTGYLVLAVLWGVVFWAFRVLWRSRRRRVCNVVPIRPYRERQTEVFTGRGDAA